MLWITCIGQELIFRKSVFFFYEKRDTNRQPIPRKYTVSLIPQRNQNRQLDGYQTLISGQVCLRYPHRAAFHSPP